MCQNFGPLVASFRSRQQLLWVPFLSLVIYVVLVSPGLTEDPEEVKEEVEDVEIEADGGVDIFLGRHSVCNHVRVEDDEEREDNSTANTYGQMNHLRLKEHLEEGRERNR